MNINTFLFFIFSLLCIFSSILVIISNNAVQSVLFLVLTFCNVACLLILLGAEFLAFLLIIVYVGAIAVLFLFVVMMLNIKLNTNFFNIVSILPISFIIFIFLLSQFSYLIYNLDLERFCDANLLIISWFKELNTQQNIIVIGEIIYTNYSFIFIIAGFILLVAMIGAIVLTMHQRINLKQQNIEFQLLRVSQDSIKFLQLRK